MPAPPTTYWVYVIERDADVLAEKDRHDLGKGALYVGYTFLRPNGSVEEAPSGNPTGGRGVQTHERPDGVAWAVDPGSAVSMMRCQKPGP